MGGGIAGVSAALAARRSGCSVLLIEKSVVLGGLATLGFIAIYLPLCDGRGRKVSAGISEELLRLSIKYGYNDLPPEWRDGRGVGASRRYSTMFSPPEFIYALDELMAAEGVHIMFDTLFCKPVMNGDRCEAVIVENKGGRMAYRAKAFVDSTGDADLFFRAGTKCTEEENYLAYWFYRTDLRLMQKAVKSGEVKDGISLEWRGSFLNDGSYTLGGEKEYKGTDAAHITRFILNARKVLKEEIARNVEAKGAIIALPGMAQYRRTRHIDGVYCLEEADAMKSFADSIGCVGHWMKPGIVYEIPYRSLVAADIANVLASGRIIAASGDAWEATRVIPPAAVTGQAAGVAAALTIRKACAAADLPVAELQEELRRAGVLLHYQSQKFLAEERA
jgi:hypothetical protein